jgi:membrane-bound serine protease (ClpP class)
MRAQILANLSEPNRAYIVLLLGILLVYREFLRPGRVLPGVLGAVFSIGAAYGLAQSDWTWYGIALMSASLVLVVLYARDGGIVWIIGAAALFAAGSVVLIRTPYRIAPGLGALGFVFVLATGYLGRAARAGRAAKRRDI